MSEHTEGKLRVGEIRYDKDLETGKEFVSDIVICADQNNDPVALVITGDGVLIAQETAEAIANRFVDCWNACAGINPDAVREMLKVLRRCRGYIKYVSGLPLGRSEERDGGILFEQIKAAIALTEEED